MQFNKLIQQSLIWRSFYFVAVLLLNVVLSRFLKAELSGQVYFVTNIFSFIILLAGANLETGFTYFGSSNNIAQNKLASFGIAWTFASIVLLLPFLIWMVHKFNLLPFSSAAASATYAIFFIIGLMLTNFFSVIFYSQRNFFTPNVVLGSLNFLLIAIILVIGLLLQNTQKIVQLYFLFFLLQGLALVFCFFDSGESPPFELPLVSEAKLLIQYSSLALVANLVFFFVYKIDYWFVQYYCTAADLGNYIQAAKLGQLLLVIPQIIASAVFPQTASGQLLNDVGDSIIKLFRLFIQVFLLIMLIVAILGKWLFPFVFGSTFGHMQVPLLVLLPGIFSLAVLSLISAFLLGKGKMRMEIVGAVIGLVIVVVGDVLVIPRYGIVGAALVSTIGYTANFAYALYCFSKLHSFNKKSLLRFHKSDWIWLFQVFKKPQ